MKNVKLEVPRKYERQYRQEKQKIQQVNTMLIALQDATGTVRPT